MAGKNVFRLACELHKLRAVSSDALVLARTIPQHQFVGLQGVGVEARNVVAWSKTEVRGEPIVSQRAQETVFIAPVEWRLLLVLLIRIRIRIRCSEWLYHNSNVDIVILIVIL